MSDTRQVLQGRVALVTGGSRGIGRAIALGLAGDGADVAVTYVEDGASAAATVAEVEALGRRAVACRLDLAEPTAIAAAVEATIAELGIVDILVNNAAAGSRGQPVVDSDPEEPARLFAVLAAGPFRLCQLVVPGMRARPRGDVVMISSAITSQFPRDGAPYAMGKAALEALAVTLAREERGNGVRVNVVAPDFVDTVMGRRLARAVLGTGDMAELAPRCPFGRVCTPEDVAGVVRFLVSDAGGYITAQKIVVDGGGSPVMTACLSAP